MNQKQSIFDKLIVTVSNNIGLTLLVYLATIAIGSSLFCYFENRTLWDSFHWAVTTALTIGYGEIVPTTTGSRLVFFVFGHLWVLFLVPCIVANIIVRILRNEHEFTHDEQEQIKADIAFIKECFINGRKKSPGISKI